MLGGGWAFVKKRAEARADFDAAVHPPVSSRDAARRAPPAVLIKNSVDLREEIANASRLIHNRGT
jgi:hypothetical protein